MTSCSWSGHNLQESRAAEEQARLQSASLKHLCKSPKQKHEEKQRAKRSSVKSGLLWHVTVVYQKAGKPCNCAKHAPYIWLLHTS